MDTNEAIGTIQTMLDLLDREDALAQSDIKDRATRRDALNLSMSVLKGTLDTQLKSLTPEQVSVLSTPEVAQPMQVAQP